jgi:hypothetical protein
MDEKWSVLAVREVVKDCLACWLWMISSGGDPTEVWRILLLPPG